MHTFHRPKTRQALYELLAVPAPNRFLLAGGTDLIIHLREKKIHHADLIDLTGIPDFSTIQERPDAIFIGAGVTMTELEQNPVVQTRLWGLSQAGARMGSTQIRNRATVGGNVVNAANCADTIPCLFALQAQVLIGSAAGGRKVSLTDFYRNGKSALAPDEAVEGFLFPKRPVRSAFVKLGSRKAVSISKISCCIALEQTPDSTVTAARVWLGSLGPLPVRGELIEDLLRGRIPAHLTRDEILSAAAAQVQTLIPTRGSLPYKQEAMKGVLADLMEELSHE